MTSPNDLARAGNLLRAGRLVAFPTETVYGLGADATSAQAVQRIFEAKGRPSTNPLICHVADAAVARRYARTWPDAASQLTEHLWPGALTIILPKTPDIPGNVTAGLDSVGLRAPNHPLTLELLKAFDKPLAGPSANRSSHVSPTTAQHVRDDLGDRVDLILDGGPCAVGIESTVLDLTTPVPLIRRPGAISRLQIESIIGPIDISTTALPATIASPSPGQHEKHYAPRTPAFRFETSQRHRVPDSGAALITISPTQTLEHHAARVAHAALPNQPESYAKDFYAVLRSLDALGMPSIYIEMPPDKPQWLAVRDRIIRATKPLPD